MQQLQLREGLAHTRTEYGCVLLDQRAGQYWQLNETGAEAVDAMMEPISMEALVERIVECFDVDSATAFTDVSTLVEQFHSAELITIRES